MSDVIEYYAYYIEEVYLDAIESDLGLPDLWDIDDAEFAHDERSYLYAITTSKTYAKHFEACRYKPAFLKKMLYVKNEDREKFELKILPFRIGKRPFRTKLTVDGEILNGDMVIEVPTFEYDAIIEYGDTMFTDMIEVVDNYVTDEMQQDIITNKILNIFTDEYRTLFNKLYLSEVLSPPIPPDELPWEVYTALDQFMMYAREYGDLYRKEGLVTLCRYGDFISSRKRPQG